MLIHRETLETYKDYILKYNSYQQHLTTATS